MSLSMSAVFAVHWFSLYPKTGRQQCLICPHIEIGLFKCVYSCCNPTQAPLSPSSSAVYHWLFQLPSQRKRPICAVGKCLPLSPLLSGERGYQQRKFLKFLYSDTGAHSETNMSTQALAHARTLKTHQESMESPSAITWKDFLLLCECEWAGGSERECGKRHFMS